MFLVCPYCPRMTTTDFEYTLFGLVPNTQYTVSVFTFGEGEENLFPRSANAQVTQTTGKFQSKK